MQLSSNSELLCRSNTDVYSHNALLQFGVREAPSVRSARLTRTLQEKELAWTGFEPVTFLHSRQDTLTTELSSLAVTPYKWDPSDREWIRVVTQLARRCGQEGRCSTCTCPHRPVTVVNWPIPTLTPPQIKNYMNKHRTSLLLSWWTEVQSHFRFDLNVYMKN